MQYLKVTKHINPMNRDEFHLINNEAYTIHYLNNLTTN